MVNDLLIGGGETLLVLDSILTEPKTRAFTNAKWLHNDGNETYVLCSPNNVISINRMYKKGSYNPIVSRCSIRSDAWRYANWG